MKTNKNGKKSSFMLDLTKLLTNHQKYYVMIMIVTLGFGIVIYGLVVQMNSQYNLISSEIEANELQRPLLSLYEKINKHRLLTDKFLTGDRTTRNEIRKSEAVIQQDMRALVALRNDYLSALQGEGVAFLNRNNDPIQFTDLQTQWDSIQKKSLSSPLDQSHQDHQRLLDDLSAMIKLLEESINPDTVLKMASFFLTEAVVYYFPQQIEDLNQLNRLIVQDATEQTSDVVSQLILLQNNYQTIKDYTEKAIQEIDPVEEYRELKQSLKYSFSNYESVMDRYILLVEQFAYGKQAGPIEFSAESQAALKASFAFWRDAEDVHDQILAIRMSEVYPGQYVLLGFSLFITLLGVFMGKFFVKMVVSSIENLDKGYRGLNRGDLSTRVPVIYKDEIGRASIGFNKMAETLEALITQLRQLFEATKRLSEGDFSTRVVVDRDASEEIQKLTDSFNTMAQSFEEIISQVNRLGVNLISSSKEISETTQQHDESSSNQEKTTREILTISNEISQNAKDFATTIRDVTSVVEQTSGLANKGKESLNQMETIMRQMVEASADIASKLGILNDKAGNINAVITTITNVADQINLLSLNAAIIADRAGEDGRSFSVIAGEIRSLADQTALATLDIDKIVDEMMSAVSASVMGVDDFIQEIRNGVTQNERVAEHLAKIIERVQALAPRFELVNDGMNTQLEASRLIDDAINKLSSRAQLTAESMHQFAITTNELNESAVYLKSAVSKILEIKR